MNLAEHFWLNLINDDTAPIFVGIDQQAKPIWQLDRAGLRQNVRDWQTALLAADLQPGNRLAISLHKTPALISLHIAALASGLIIVPLNYVLTSIEATRVLTKAEVKLAITDLEVASRLKACSHLVTEWWITEVGDRELPTDLPENMVNSTVRVSHSQRDVEIVARSKDDAALLVFTSGTTGEPKGVGITHGNLIANLTALLKECWQMTPADRLLHVLPPHHIHGLGLGIYGSLFIGNSVVMMEKFETAPAITALIDYQITVLMAVPTIYHRLAEAAELPKFPHMRLFISGSAPLSAETFQRFAERTGFTILERYGLTETIINSSNPLNGARRAGTVGLPLSGVEIGIFAPGSEQQLPPGELGEVRVKGDNVFPGYWQDQQATAASFSSGWFCTGDLGRFDAEGYLTLSGRIKELMIVGGSNVTPGEVEAVIEPVTGVAECAVTGLPDAELGERIAAFIVLRTGVPQALVQQRIELAVAQALATYKRPRKYFFVEALPRNAMGKVMRNNLKELAFKREAEN